MNDELKTILSCYDEVADIDGNHNVTLVQHITSKAFYVKKKLSVYNAKVYDYLKKNPIAGIPRVHEATEVGGELYIIEEYISGDTLESAIQNGNKFSDEQTADIVLKLLSIISALHNSNPAIIHRDIKPANIIISSSGDVYLVDMNAAKIFTPEKFADTELIGTEGYASPEQYGFATSSASSDIYSIGVLMNVMLTGKTPVEEIATGRLALIIKKCTSIDPVNRYQSCEELAGTIRHAMGRENFSVKASRFLPPGFRTGKLDHMIIASLGYGLLLLLTFTLRSKDSKLPVLSNIAFFISALSIVLFSCNYLGTQDKVIVSRIKSKAFKTALIIFIDFFIIFICILIICVIPESFVE